MKSVRRASDLAISGAAPAFTSELRVGLPNIGSRELFLKMAGEILDRRVLSNSGPLVQDLEAALAEKLGVGHVVATCNGTVALEIAVRALGLSGEIIVPAYTFIATAHAVSWPGLVPVFADIDASTHNLDPRAVEAAIGPRTSAILATHLWGRAAPVEALQAIASRHGLALIFDAAHAFSCTHGGRFIGNFGDCEVFSFHATKVFNTFEGGAIATNSLELAERLRRMRNFGFTAPDVVVDLGTNGKMPEICAAMGLVNLRSLNEFVTSTRRNYETYAAELDRSVGLELLRFDGHEVSNFQYAVVEAHGLGARGRDYLLQALAAEGVMARKYFWPGCDRAAPYREHGDARLENTRAVADRVLVLPNGSHVSPEATATISHILNVAAESSRSILP